MGLAGLSLAVFGFARAAGGSPVLPVLALGFFVFFVFYCLNYRILHIRIIAEDLRLRFGLFSWTIPLGNIESCALDAVSLGRIGGAGVHFTLIGGRYRVMFNFLEYPRVVVGLKRQAGPVRDVVFSTGNPRQVLRLLQPKAEPAESPASETT
jgi:hypothetical protein